MDYELKEDGKFKYLEEGSGPNLVLLHGLFGALSNYEHVIEHFNDRYTVIIPMLPLYELPIINTNVKNLAKFLKEFLLFKGIDKVNLLGNSLGGHIALVFTEANPEKVSSLILTASSGLYENAFGNSFPRREDKEFIRKKVAVTFYDPKHANDELVDECFAMVNDRNKVIRVLAIAKSAIRHNMGKDIQHMKMPVCLIWGKDDTITPPEVAEEFHEKMENSSLYWIDKCGHAPMMERPKEFNEHLDGWMKENEI
ncbi:MAG TPA: alpha/beta hydrolase [Flavobacteriales bacterium]|nr:alpha/beta hydrolase [Flavobacteriales bacterium]